jgi:hypothetical protein
MLMDWDRKDEEGRRADLMPHRWARLLLLPAAAAVLLAMACLGFSGPGARAAQAPASTQPAKSQPEAAPAPEKYPAQAAQPTAAGEPTPESPGEVTPNAGASAAGRGENGGNPVAADCASLQKLATDLKAEVDKTTKDELSVNVVRKAGEIEQLAREIRDKKGTTGRK